MKSKAIGLACALAMLAGAPTAALAQANCQNSGNFEAWLAALRKSAPN